MYKKAEKMFCMAGKSALTLLKKKAIMGKARKTDTGGKDKHTHE